MKTKKNNSTYAVLFTPAEEGGYTATVPALPGCISEGDSFEAAERNIAEAIALYVSTVTRLPNRSDRSDFIVAPVRG